MGKIKEIEKALLQKMMEELERTGFSVQIHQLEENAREELFIVGFDSAGDRGDSHEVEVSFLFKEEKLIEEMGFHVLQIFCCLCDDLPTDTCNGLARAVLRLNPKIPAGAFGINEENRSLYYKSTSLLTDNMDEETAYPMLQVHVGVFLRTLDLYNDVLMDIIDGNRKVEDAIKKGLV